MDYPLISTTTLLFFVGGWLSHCEYQRLSKCWPNFSLTNFHSKPGWMRWFLLLLLIVLLPSGYWGLNRPSMWYMPEWLDLGLLWWSNGLGAMLFGALFGLAWAAYKRETLPNARALALAAGLSQVGLIFMIGLQQELVAHRLSSEKWSGTILRQTSESSCAPTSAANIAGILGLRYSEQDMGRFMATRSSGTSPAFIVRGLRKAGIEARRFDLPDANLPRLPCPALLIVDHPRAGPESHAVAAMKFHPEKNAVEIWDPARGIFLLSQPELKSIWSGHGIACSRVTH